MRRIELLKTRCGTKEGEHYCPLLSINYRHKMRQCALDPRPGWLALTSSTPKRLAFCRREFGDVIEVRAGKVKS